ncbi:MAG: glycosyltransferase family 39 protein [Actinomycetota bacterium]|nr:glycosyltransferase family 39 protein [Actinomycetota bacterium]
MSTKETALPTDHQHTVGPRTFVRGVSLAILLGAVIRLAYIVWLHRVGNYGIGDSYIYHREGLQLARGDGWINPALMELYGIRRELAMHPPAYSLWLALWSWIGLTSEFAHQLITIPLGLATIAVVGNIGRRVWSPKVGIAAALVAAVHPSFWSWEGMLLQEPMAILATSLLLLAMLRLIGHLDVKSVLLGGVAAGFAPLTRAELISTLAICLLVILIAHRSRRALAATVGVGLLAIAIVAPWSIHNARRFDKFVPLSNGFGVTLAATNCDELTGAWLGYWSLRCSGAAAEEVTRQWAAEHPDAEFIPIDVAGTINPLTGDNTGAEYLARGDFQYPEFDESEVDAAMTALTIDWMKEHPGFLVRSVPARLGRVLGIYRPIQQVRLDIYIENRKKLVAVGAWLGYYALAPFVLVGAWLLKRRSGRDLLLLLAPVCSALFVIASTFGNTRYRAIAEPTMAVLGTIGVAALWCWLRDTWREQPQRAPHSPLTEDVA